MRGIYENEAAQAVFDNVGPGKRFLNQLELRAGVGVGSSHFIRLREDPTRVDDEILVRIADTIEYPIDDLFKKAGKSPPSPDLVQAVRAITRHRPARRDLQSHVKTPTAFFDYVAERAAGQPFLVTTLFNDRPLAADNQESSKRIVELLCAKKMSFALTVPTHVGPYHPNPAEYENGNAFSWAAQRFETFKKVHSFARNLVRLATLRGKDVGKDVRRRIGVYTLNRQFIAPEATRLLTGSVLTDERTCLVVFADDGESQKPKAPIVATWAWDRIAQQNKDFVIIHDEEVVNNTESAAILGRFEAMFGEITRQWQESNYGELPAEGDIWLRTDKGLEPQGLLVDL